VADPLSVVVTVHESHIVPAGQVFTLTVEPLMVVICCHPGDGDRVRAALERVRARGVAPPVEPLSPEDAALEAEWERISREVFGGGEGA
jgi:hypothetical protein